MRLVASLSPSAARLLGSSTDRFSFSHHLEANFFVLGFHLWLIVFFGWGNNRICTDFSHFTHCKLRSLEQYAYRRRFERYCCNKVCFISNFRFNFVGFRFLWCLLDVYLVLVALGFDIRIQFSHLWYLIVGYSDVLAMNLMTSLMYCHPVSHILYCPLQVLAFFCLWLFWVHNRSWLVCCCLIVPIYLSDIRMKRIKHVACKTSKRKRCEQPPIGMLHIFFSHNTL